MIKYLKIYTGKQWIQLDDEVEFKKFIAESEFNFKSNSNEVINNLKLLIQNIF